MAKINYYYVYETKNGSRSPLTKKAYNQLVKNTSPDLFIIRIETGEDYQRFIFKELNL